MKEGNIMNWCYVVCGGLCYGGIISCAGACVLDGPMPLLDATAANISAGIGAGGSTFGGMFADNGINK